MPNKTKDTIYIEADDEITAVIDKVINAKHKIVALVLPKRAAVFQSPVNMKLLKKAAKSAGKNLVLITSEKSILAIASVSSMHVAKSLSSKPEIPSAPLVVTQNKMEDSDSADTEDTEKSDAADEDSIELDNTSPEELPTEKKKSKKLLKIPDFTSFRAKITFGVLAIITLIVLWYVGFVVMPKATVTINTDTSTTSINSEITAQVGKAELDLETNVLPAERVQVEKINTSKVAATGQKNIGNKATGVITLTNCISDGEKKVVAAGTRFSKDNATFETAEQVILSPGYVDEGVCRTDELPPSFGAQKNVDVVALEPGPQFNISEGTFNSSISGIRAYGSDMAGGTTQIITVISEEDVQKAEGQLSGQSKGQALSEMRTELEGKGKMPLDETLGEGDPKTTVVPAVGEEASEVEVTVTITYSLLGINKDDLSDVLDNEVRKNIGDEEKNIKDNGIESVVFQLKDRPNEAESVLGIQTVATIGPELNEESLKVQIAGKKRGDIEKEIESIDGVRSVSVEYSPFWITTTPKSAEKITIIFTEPDEQ